MAKQTKKTGNEAIKITRTVMRYTHVVKLINTETDEITKGLHIDTFENEDVKDFISDKEMILTDEITEKVECIAISNLKAFLASAEIIVK